MIISLLRNRALRCRGVCRQPLRLTLAAQFSDEKEALRMIEVLMKSVMNTYEDEISDAHKIPSKQILFAAIFGVKIPKTAEFKTYIRAKLLKNEDNIEETESVPILQPVDLKAISKKEVTSDPQAKIFYGAIGRIYAIMLEPKNLYRYIDSNQVEILYREWMRVRIAASVGFPKEPMTMARLLGIDGALRALRDRPNQLLESIKTRLHSSLQLQSYDISETTLQHSSREVSDRAAFIAELEKVPVDRRQPIAFIRPHSDPLKKGEFWDLCLKVRYTPVTAAKGTSKEVEEEEEHCYYIFVDNKTASEWCENTTKEVAAPLRRMLMRQLDVTPTEHRHLTEKVFTDRYTATPTAGVTGGHSTGGGGIEYVYLYMGDINYYSKVIDTHAMLIGGDYVGNFYGRMHDWYHIIFQELSRKYFGTVSDPSAGTSTDHHPGTGSAGAGKKD